MKNFLILFLGFIWGIFSLNAQFSKNYDIQSMNADLVIYPYQKSVEGNVQYSIILKKNADSIVFDALNLNILNVKSGFFSKNYYFSNKYLVIRKKFKKHKKYKIEIEYNAFPTSAMYFVGWNGKGIKQVWTQGQGKRNSHWLPVNDDQNDKFTWKLSIATDPAFQVISNGVKILEKTTQNGFKKHIFMMDKPAPAYLIFVGVGKFAPDTIRSASGKPVYNYMYENRKNNNKTYYKSKEIFDFIENEIGVQYPWVNYKQIPLRDFLYGGMENVSATSFNGNRYVVDSIEFHDVNYVNVQAHELTHQWFGDWVTGKSGKDHWLHEGFATYYARLTDSLIFGDDYYQHEIYKYDKQIIEASNTDTIPIHRKNASSLSYYQKGARVIQMLRNRVGDKPFKKVIQSFLKKYQFNNASIEDLQNEFFLQTGDSLKDFFHFWLDTSQIPYFQIQQKGDSIVFKQNTSHQKIGFLLLYPKRQKLVYTSENFLLKNSDTLVSVIVNPNNQLLAKIEFDRKKQWIKNQILYAPYFIDRLIALQQIHKWKDRSDIYEILLNQNENDFINREIARQIIKNPPPDKNKFIKKLLKKGLKTRQYLAEKLQKIPTEFKQEYISILKDSSYISKQAVLWHYLMNFPDEAVEILNRTQKIQGANDKSFRMTWLTLALLVKDYQLQRKKDFYAELVRYTSDDYPFNVRLNAFYTLLQLDLFNEQSIENLMDASLHFNWHFHKDARHILQKIYKRKKYREIIDNLLKNKYLHNQKFFKTLLEN